MDREQIISFIERIRPQIKEAGAPDDVLLAAAKENNLAPAQLESTAQMLNTVQQLNFMDKAANRGDTFKLIDVPELVNRFTSHNTPEAMPRSTPDNNFTMAKAASEVTTGTLPLQGKRLPDVNAKLLKDAGVPEPKFDITPAPALPRTERSLYKEQRVKEAALSFELQGVQQLIDDNREVLRKEADEIAYRLRTEPSFSWAEAKSDGMYIAKEATITASPVIEDYLAQLGSVHGHKKVAFTTEPATQPGMLVTDRHNIEATLRKMATAIGDIERLSDYREHLKSGAMTEPPVRLSPTNQPETGDEDEDEDEDGNTPRPPRPPRTDPRDADANEGGIFYNGPSELNAPSILDIITPPDRAIRTGGEIHDDIAGGIDSTADAITNALKSVPGPGTATRDTLDLLDRIKPGTNKKQRSIDQGTEDVKTVTNLQRLMLTDPIIRDADPEMVMTLFNTLQNANSEITKDPNLLRFALRESLQYESVPMHTYKDLVEIDEKKQKAREMSGKNEGSRYAIS